MYLRCVSMVGQKRDAVPHSEKQKIPGRKETSYLGLLKYLSKLFTEAEVEALCKEFNVDDLSPRQKKRKTAAEDGISKVDTCLLFMKHVFTHRSLSDLLEMIEESGHPYSKLSQAQRNEFKGRLGFENIRGGDKKTTHFVGSNLFFLGKTLIVKGKNVEVTPAFDRLFVFYNELYIYVARVMQAVVMDLVKDKEAEARFRSLFSSASLENVLFGRRLNKTNREKFVFVSTI